MAFGMNRVELIGRLGADVTVNHLASGGRVANLSIATEESYINKNTGEKVDKTEWHRVVTVQDDLIDMLDKRARKGRLIHAEGKLQTRRWKKDGEDPDRFSTEILVVPAIGSSSWTSRTARTATARRPRPTRRRTEMRVARVSLFAAQAIARKLIADGRENEVQEIRDFISTIVPHPEK